MHIDRYTKYFSAWPCLIDPVERIKVIDRLEQGQKLGPEMSLRDGTKGLEGQF